jgi:hypothetical protein
MVITVLLRSVLWIRIGSNAYLERDPAFYFDVDPDPGQILPSQKVVFFPEKYTLCR